MEDVGVVELVFHRIVGDVGTGLVVFQRTDGEDATVVEFVKESVCKKASSGVEKSDRCT